MTVAIDEDVFVDRSEPLRGELTAHCYRMMGSVHEAEDLVQETYLRAWRAFDRFEQRSSVRTWMYRIATNACLTALEGRGRRPMPVGLGQPASDPHAACRLDYEVTWLEPLPDAVVWGGPAADPAAAVVDRESVRLAFVAALQHLTPPQRAVLILRDVLAWQASEVAELLELSVAAVNSSLQRARAHGAPAGPGGRERRALDDDRAKELLADYVAAFENYDVPRIVELLSRGRGLGDAAVPRLVPGRRGDRQLIRRNCPAARPGDQVLVPVGANGQPAFGLYMRQPDGTYAAFQLQVLTLERRPVSATSGASSTSACSSGSGCPPRWTADRRAGLSSLGG